MLIRSIIALLLSVPAFYLTFRYNMHMFQLNGYKNGEHRSWLKKNRRLQWILRFGLILGFLRVICGLFAGRCLGDAVCETVVSVTGIICIVLDVLIYLTLLVIIPVYSEMRRMTTKKKLVYTARVKRMLATNLVVTGVILCVAAIFTGFSLMSGLALMLVSAQFFMTIVSNVINHPVEKGVSQHYINDASRKLRENKNLKIIGVTGSYGKTSVKFYLQTLLQAKFDVLVTPESYNTPMGIVRTVREHLKSTHEIFVCEMGARHVGDIKEICDFVHPHHGVITAVGPQHLETFFNMENIKDTKFELADALPADGMLFLNGDNEYIQQKAVQYNNKFFYSVDGASGFACGGYRAMDIKLSQLGTEFTVVTPEGEKASFQMRLIGGHNVINVVGAIAVAHQLGMSLEELKIPVRRIQPVEHRMQMREHGAVTIIDDAYNSNPVGSKAAVETLAMFDGIRILITPGMVELGDKEYEYNKAFGGYAADCCDYILLVGRKRAVPIREGVLEKSFEEKRCLVFDKLEEAMNYAYSVKGDGHKYILLENDLPDNY